MSVYDVLNYPEKGRNPRLERILNERGVTLLPYGTKEVFGVPVLGKGWSSLVVYGVYHGKGAAVKIWRTDSTRVTSRREASLLRTVNAHGIGPTLYDEGENVLIEEYIPGKSIREIPVKREHIHSFLTQCNTLDLLGIDHGQIQGGKHLIVGEKCCIIDFEKGGWRTPRNVSSLVSELFLRETPSAREIRRFFHVEREEVIKAVQAYCKTFDMTLLNDLLRRG